MADPSIGEVLITMAMGRKECRFSLWTCLVVVALFIFLLPSAVFPQIPFYQGKTITIINGNPPANSKWRQTEEQATMNTRKLKF